jgi:hypothetical protein
MLDFYERLWPAGIALSTTFIRPADGCDDLRLLTQERIPLIGIPA